MLPDDFYQRDVPEPEDFEPKEVFAFFGLASYTAQVLEQALLCFAAMLHLSGKTGVTRELVDRLFDRLETHTLGQLLAETRKVTTLSDHADALLRRAIGKRNFLTHHFFAEHAADFMLEDGRSAMIAELRAAVQLFHAATAEVDRLHAPFATRYGLTNDKVEAIMEEELASAGAKRRDA